VNDLVGGGTVELLGRNAQGTLGVNRFAGVNGVKHLANAGLQFALYGTILLPPLEALAVALLSIFRMGHGFRYG